ncbi:MAG: FprA family A-type flavoprotein [Oscillospiraceae bacterium]|nr:FprA family A-type flavoprotein [Oscillospiraceae bacterium]
MFQAKKIKENIYWVGALDPGLRIFDIVMCTPYGSSYNSYVIKGSDKIALIDTVKEKFFDEFLDRLNNSEIDISKIDYIIVNHAEPDHSGSIYKILNLCPNAKIVGSNAAIGFVKEICNFNVPSIVVSDGGSLNLGNKTLKFISAPFLHWPDSMFTYLIEDKILFTCDAFGSHYCEENIFDDLVKDEDIYFETLKYYFDVILSPFKKYVVQGLDKIKDLDIEMVCTGHGPILRKNFQKVRDLYVKWSAPKEKDGKKLIVIPYVTSYGYTEKLANAIASGINSLNEDIKVKLFNMIDFKKEDVLPELDNCDGMIFGSPTINSDALLPIMDILINLNPIIHGGKKAASFGSYGWSGEATKNIESRLKELRLSVPVPSLKVKFNPSNDQLNDAFEFGKSFALSILKKA